jgi:hypothetical protein
MEEWARKGSGPRFFRRNARVVGYHLTVIEEFARDRKERLHHRGKRAGDQGAERVNKDCRDDD